MSKISKSFLALSAIVFMTAFMPLKYSQAAIFEGSVDAGTGVRFGLCLDNPEDHPECASVDCSSPQGETEVALCTSEAAAGTGIAKGSLEGSGITHTDNFGDFIIKLVNFALPYLTLAAFVGYVIAGFLYVTALGNDEQMTKAKKILIWSSIGLILVILSYAITNLLTGQLVESLAG